MKAKACTKCRQWKARCDAADGVPGSCSRCRSLNLPCVFDASFKRLSKDKRIQQMSAEIQQLRQALRISGPSNPSTSPHVGEETNNGRETPVAWDAQLPGPSESTTGSSPTLISPFLPANSIDVAATVPPAATSHTLGDVTLTWGQIERYFKTYFTRHHRHLPFRVASESPNDICPRSPLLFWVICAVTSSWKQQGQLAPMIKTMIADTIHTSTNSVETVQALLIMCMWPFKTARLSEDPSNFYSSIAAQMSLQLGLHRPSQPYWPLRHGSLSGPSTETDEEIRLTTWLACYVVNQMLSSHLGVPSAMSADANLLNAFGNPAVEKSLSQLCRIYHLLMQLSWAISANAPTPTGMVKSATRLMMIGDYREQLTALERTHLTQMDDMVKISFLYSRLQLCSFDLLDDVPFSPNLRDLVHEAEVVACELIELSYEMNLSSAPILIRRAMCYSAFVLTRLVQLPHDTHRELLYDSIERVRESLSTTVSAPDDISRKACTILQDLPYSEYKRRSPPILSRMGASLFYDSLRVHWEHCLERHEPAEDFDIDKFDWNELGL